MNKKAKIITILIGVMTATSILAGCQSGTKSMTIDDQKKFVNELNVMLSDSKDANEIGKALDEKIKSMDKTNASDAINAYIYSLYFKNSELTSKMDYLGAELKEFATKNNIDLTKTVDTKKLPDGLMKGLIEEVQNNHMIFKSDQSNYYVVVDMNYINDKYGKYMNDDLKAFTEFRVMEDSVIVFNGKTNEFNMDELVNRILKIEKEIPKWKETKFNDQWVGADEYYYGLIFGVTQNYFNEDNKDNSVPKVKDSIMTKYDEIISKNEGTDFAKDLKGYVDLLKKNGNKIVAEVDDYRTKLMTTKFPDKTTTPTENSNIPTGTASTTTNTPATTETNK